MNKKIKITNVFYNNELPSDWKISKINDIGEVKGGFAFDSTKFKECGKYQVIKMSNLFENKLDLCRSQSFLDDLTEQEREYILTKGEIIITLTGTIGKRDYGYSFQLDYEENLLLNQRVAKIKVTKADPTYVSYQIKTNRFLNQFFFSARGGTGNQANVGIQDLASMKVILPPLPEQKAIANVLSTWDEAIRITENLRAQKEFRRKWLMQNLLMGKKRLKGYEGEWKKERLEKYLVKHDERSTENNQYPVLTSSRRGIFLQSDYYTRDVASEDNTGYNVVPRGYFTYRHMSDDLIFKFNINEIVDKGIVSTLYPVFTIKDINSYFLLMKLNEGSEFKMHAEEQKQGGSRTYVYFKTLCQLKLYMPSIEEQTAIAQVLQAAEKEINLLKTKVQKLREQKKGLMQVLLTGRVRLKLKG
jgi:type I restriction enzyme S subunit